MYLNTLTIKIIKLGLSSLSFFILACFVFTNPTYAWWNDSWSYRQKLTFDNSSQSENLTSFPVMVKLTTSNFDFTKTQSSGADIRFVDSDDLTALSYEIEKWDSSDQEAIIWVKVPQVDASSSTDSIYMYYGNSSATDSQTANNVWDSNYAMVYHLQQGSGTYTDSTSNNNYGTVNGSITRNIDGKVDGASQFTAVGGICTPDCSTTVPNSLKMETGDITISFWGNTTTIGSGQYIVGHGSVGQAVGYRVVSTSSSGVGIFRFRLADATQATTLDSNSVTDGNWHFYTFVKNGSTISLYVDGAFVRSTTTPITSFTTQTNAIFSAAARYTGGALGLQYTGYLDEMKISNSVRSANYLAADYKTTNDTFITYGSVTNNQPISSSSTSTSTSTTVITTSPVIFDPNMPTGWSKRIMAGPHFVGVPNFLSNNTDALGVSVLITKETHHDDLFILLDMKRPDELPYLSTAGIKFPWSQEFNVASEIYEIKALSSFNGYPIVTTDKPFTLLINYDPLKLNGISNSLLKIARYEPNKEKWITLDTPNVIDPAKHTITNVTRDFGYYVVVYPRNVGNGGIELTKSSTLGVSTEQSHNEETLHPSTINPTLVKTSPSENQVTQSDKNRFCILKWCF